MSELAVGDRVVHRTRGIVAADDHAQTLIITRNMDGRQRAAMFTAFLREVYGLRERVAEHDAAVADMMGHDGRAVARCLRGSV